MKLTELLILKFLGFRVNFTTCLDFLTCLHQEFKFSIAILETAKIICYYSQIFYGHLEFKASQVGYSALIIACTSLNQHSLATRLIEKYQDVEALNSAIRRIRSDLSELNKLKNLYISPSKFLRFEIVLKKPGPLFKFNSVYLEQEQRSLISRPN